MGECFANEISNDVEKYEIEVTKMGQKYSFFSYSVALMHGTRMPVEWQ